MPAVGSDLLVGEQLPGFVLAGRVADARGAGAHQHHRAVAVALQQAQQHDLHQAADVQAVRGAVEADIGGDDSRLQGGLQAVGIGALVDETAGSCFVQEVGAGHGSDPLSSKGRAGASTGGNRMEMMRAIGLMSGTSLDGVDAAWLETDGERIGQLGPTLTLPYDAALRAGLRALLDRAPSLSRDDPDVAEIAAGLTARHVEAVRAIGLAADIVGFHGQTILHQPALGLGWQIGDAHLLARETGMRVAWDFRSADLAAGGEGAPLAPLWHAALAAPLPRPLAVLNIGGVANVTWLGLDDALLACDTGPGNGPLDDWAARHGNHDCDRDGALSARGRVDAAVLARLLADPYFARPMPKSLDRLDFAATLATSGLGALSPADGAATLVAFTAEAVARAPLPQAPRRWLVCGGGRHNPSIMAALAQRLGAVAPVEAAGWDGDALEAQCFGFLAVRALRGLPLSVPGTTGVPRPLPGGRIAEPA